jgi:hypothetical protein
MKEDRSLLILTHLSQLIVLITGFGNLILPLIIWLSKKNEVYDMDRQGKEIVNFQISLLIYFLICIPLILMLGIGLVGFMVLGISAIIFPIINTIKVINGDEPKYPFVFKVIK